MSTVRRVFTGLHASLVLVGLLAAATPASADAVTDWNSMAIGFINSQGTFRPPGPFGFIDAATVHIAIHDAVQAYQHRFKTYTAPIPNASGSIAAAVAKAAHDVLVSRFQIPSVNAPLIAQVDTAYTNYLIANNLPVNDPGVAVGAQAALQVIVARANDGAFPANPEIFTGSTEPGQWRPTPPALLPMAGPWIGAMTPFVPRNDGKLQNEPPPPHLTSGLYTRDFNEVKLMGRRTNSGRTPEETTFAFFYSGNFLTILNGAVRTAALTRMTDIGDRARLFALALVAGSDSTITVWENKRTYNIWRPSTAILNAADDGNPRTEPDAGWLPLINDPPYPDYTSGANGVTGAMMRVLENVLGDQAPEFLLSTTALENGQPIAPRPYTRYSAIADDVVEARILLGIHFRFADAVARRQAKQVADRVVAHSLRPLN